jgi:hypothetical protein
MRAARLVEGRVEAALEADHAGHTGGLHRAGARAHPRDRQIDRLLAEDVLAGCGGAADQVAVRIGRRRDGHHVDRRVLQDLRRRWPPGPELLRQA